MPRIFFAVEVTVCLAFYFVRMKTLALQHLRSPLTTRYVAVHAMRLRDRSEAMY